MIKLRVLGTPATAGNKTAIPFRRKDGSLGVNVREGKTKDAARRAAEWRATLQLHAEKAMEGRALLDGPIEMLWTFTKARPAGHFKKDGSLSAEGRRAGRYVTTRPDSIKLVRSVEDALTGIVWNDDAQVAHHDMRRLWGHHNVTEVTITTLDNTPTEELIPHG